MRASRRTRRIAVRMAGITLALGLVTQLVPTWGLRSGPVVIVNRSGGIHETVAGPTQGGDPTR